MSNLATSFRSSDQIRRDRPLTDDEMRAIAPSIYAEDAHDSRSSRYAYIPTSNILAGLAKEGFQPFMVCQSRARNADRRAHTKHMVRLRHANQIVAEEANEIILINSHDGTSKYQMLAGIYRFVCSNGIIRGDELADIRIPHKGNIRDQVIEGAFTVLDQFDEVTATISEMKGKNLSEGAEHAFARAALELRYDDEYKPITDTALLRPLRSADYGHDLWTTFNRVQENIIRGGVRGRSANGSRMTTRQINGIDQNVKLNRALWVLADEMRKLVA